MKLPCARMDEGGRTCLVVKESRTGGADVEWWCIVMEAGPLGMSPLSTKDLETRFPIDLSALDGMNHCCYAKAFAKQYLIKMSLSGGARWTYKELRKLQRPSKTLAARIEARLDPP